jgi:prevent-host-death family protein
MITRSVSEARRQLSQLIEQVRQGVDVVIIKDSRPVAALRRVDDEDLDLAPELTDEQVQRLWEWSEAQPSKKFDSPEAAVRYLKKEFKKSDDHRPGRRVPPPLSKRNRRAAVRHP